MSTRITVPAKGIKSVSFVTVNPGNINTLRNGEAPEIVIESPHELTYKVSSGTLLLTIVKKAKGGKPSGPKTIRVGNSKIKIGKPTSDAWTTITFPKGSTVPIVSTNNFSS